MLTRLKLHRFRYIKPGTELLFTDSFNVLLGKNGTGKTTLLQLISMALRGDFSQFRDEEFDIEYELASQRGTGIVRFENRRKPPSDPSPSTSRGAAKVRQYHPHLSMKLQAKSPHESNEYELEVDGAVLRWRTKDGAWEGNAVVDAFENSLFVLIGWTIPKTDDGTKEMRQAVLALGHPAEWTYRFDESLGVFESITDAERNPKPGRPPPVSMESIIEDGFRMSRQSFVPSSYRPARPEHGQSSTKVDLRSNSSLAKFPQLAGLKSMSMSFAVESIHQEPDGLWWGFGRAEFLFSGAKGSVFNHDRLSYGQKRLLSFLYYLDANSQYVVADELVNGMHHDWIRACLDEIGKRQAFLTSQNPLLLDYLPLESVEQVQRTFIQCRADVVDDETQISWSNLATEDAEQLFADYKVGIQPVGEILRARGLW